MFLSFFQVSWSGKPQFSESKVFGKYSYCWWLKSCTSWYGSLLSRYLQAFIYPRWCSFLFASTVGILRVILNETHAVGGKGLSPHFLSAARNAFQDPEIALEDIEDSSPRHQEALLVIVRFFRRLVTVTLGTGFVCEGASCCLGSWWDGRTGGWERFQHEQWKNGTGCLDFRGMVWGWYYAPLEQMIAHYGTLGIWESLLRNNYVQSNKGFHVSLFQYPLSFISSTCYSSLPTSLVYW